MRDDNDDSDASTVRNQASLGRGPSKAAPKKKGSRPDETDKSDDRRGR